MSMRGGTKPGTMSEGQCWLWEDTNYRGVTENKDDIEHIKPPPHHEQKFWFESNFRCPDTTNDDEIRMRDWLDRQRLPQTIADAFVPFGVRSVEDICILLSEDEDNEIKELLSSFAPLDRRKLRKAVKALSSTSPSLLSDAETFSTVSNWLEDMD